MGNKSIMKDLSLLITVITLAATLTLVNCQEKKDDKATLFAAGALASRGNGTVATATGTGTGTGTGTAATYTIGGTVSDLWTSGLVLQNNAGDDVTVTAASGTNSGTFTFVTKVSGAYAVTVKTQPTSATCTVSGGTGTASANVTNVTVSCATSIGGNILKTLSSLTAAVTVFAGPANGTTTNGTTDAAGTAARFLFPAEITTDGTNLYVADSGNHRIRKIVISTGVVSTLAGNGSGNTDGTGTAALFNTPQGVTTDGTNLYVADSNNHRIRKIVISSGVVTTLAGSSQGFLDGTGPAAQFFNPVGLTMDGTNLYVGDTSNHRIRKIVISSGVVTTLAGSATSGFLDGTGTAAQFNLPYGLTTEGTNLYVADRSNNRIRKIVISSAVVTTIAGNGTGAEVDGTGTSAQFNQPYNIAMDGTNLYVSGNGTHKIRKIVISTGVTTTLAGSSSGDLDGTGTAALFNSNRGITSDGTSLYVCDFQNQKIRKIQ